MASALGDERRARLAAARLYLVCGAAGDGRDLRAFLDAALRGGVDIAQLREKDAAVGDEAILAAARVFRDVCDAHGALFVLNDRPDLAAAAGADGVHVGQDDMPVAEARRLLGPAKIIGLSITEAKQARAMDAAAADYLGVGPIYQQQTKEDASPPLGIEGLRVIRGLTQKPIVAIGGLTPDNSAPVIAAGADGLAVVSAIVAADDPEDAARRFVRLFG